MQENSVPIMILSLYDEDAVMKKAQISCPNLIIATQSRKSLSEWIKIKKDAITNKFNRRIAILLLEETSVQATIELIQSPSLSMFSNLVVMNQLLGVYLRDPANEKTILLADKFRNGKFSPNSVFFPKRLTTFNGITLQATSFDFPPYNFRVFDSNGEFLKQDGAELRIAEILGDTLDFKVLLKTIKSQNG